MLGIGHKPEPVDLAKQRESCPWTVRYTAVMDDGTKHSWEHTFDFGHEPEDKHMSAGNALVAWKYGHYSQVFGGKLYPPHRLHEVTWELV